MIVDSISMLQPLSGMVGSDEDFLISPALCVPRYPWVDGCWFSEYWKGAYL